MSGPTPSAGDIALRAQQLKVVCLAMTAAVPAYFYPGMPILRALLQHSDIPAEGDIPITLPNESGPEGYLSISARGIFTMMTQMRGAVVADDILTISIMHGAVRVGDMIDQGGHRDSEVPLLEFARHFRNACAHGNRWHFRGQEPRFPAIHRDLTLTQDMHGTKAAWGNVSPRRYIEFLDDITNYFQPGTVPPTPQG